MRSNEEVEGLFSQLENHFARTLHDAQLHLEQAERLKGRPSFYTKINSRNPKTLSSRRKKVETNRQAMRDQGYPDIQIFFKQPQLSRELRREAESDNNDESDGFLSCPGELLDLNDGEVAITESDELGELVGVTDQNQRSEATAMASAVESDLESISEVFQEGGTVEIAVEDEQESPGVMEQARSRESASFEDSDDQIERKCSLRLLLSICSCPARRSSIATCVSNSALHPCTTISTTSKDIACSHGSCPYTGPHHPTS